MTWDDEDAWISNKNWSELVDRVEALEAQLATLMSFLWTHRHGYRWEPTANDGRPTTPLQQAIDAIESAKP